MLFCILQEEGCLSYSPCAFYTNHTLAPVYLVHQKTSDRSVDMVHQIGVCAKESFHPEYSICFKTNAKLIIFFEFANSILQNLKKKL
jgi:hypothetical protein